MLQDEGHVGAGLDELVRRRHLAREHLEVEGEAVVGEAGDVAHEPRIAWQVGRGREAVLRVLVPVQLLADAAHQRPAREAVELWPGIFLQEIGEGDDGLRPAGAFRFARDPGHFVLEALRRPVGLDVDRRRHPRPFDVGQILLDRVVPADRPIGAEDARLHRPVEPGQVGAAPDVEVGVDDAVHGCGLPASPRTKRQSAASELPSAMSSSRGAR